jgi:hypothetical protein
MGEPQPAVSVGTILEMAQTVNPRRAVHGDAGKEGNPTPINPNISQETLAEMIGTTRSRVSFFMNKFRKLGFISYNGKIRSPSFAVECSSLRKARFDARGSNLADAGPFASFQPDRNTFPCRSSRTGSVGVG